MQITSDLWLTSGGDNLLGIYPSFQELFESKPEFKQAFELGDFYLRCMDEGTPGGVHLAGSGILYPKVLEDLKVIKQKGLLTGITSHQKCGAVELYGGLDIVGDEFAQKLAQDLDVPYIGSITVDQMPRPANLHIARVIYLTGCPFDPAKIGLPQGFQIEPWLVSDKEYIKSEIKLAIELALGHHGFGEKFTPHSPLYLISVTNNLGVLEQELISMLQEVAQDKENIKIDKIYG